MVVRHLEDGLVLPLHATHGRELVLVRAALLALVVQLAQARPVLLRRGAARKNVGRLRRFHY